MYDRTLKVPCSPSCVKKTWPLSMSRVEAPKLYAAKQRPVRTFFREAPISLFRIETISLSGPATKSNEIRGDVMWNIGAALLL